jgi:regulator of sigma E protease
VAGVEPGGPAAAAGLAKGDVIAKAEFVHGGTPEERTKLEKLSGKIFEEVELSETKESWPSVMAILSRLPDSTRLKLTWRRGDQMLTRELTPRDSATFFDDTRGIDLYGLSQTHTAKTWGEAASLGFREAVERVKEVVIILHSLVTGRISATNLSGPPGILMAAAGFASEGFSSLLIFLTILSANLAVLNFLPIPALDGGHMLFLTAEGIRGKPVDERLQIRLTIAGVICLLALMVFATAMDVGRFYELIREWF